MRAPIDSLVMLLDSAALLLCLIHFHIWALHCEAGSDLREVICQLMMLCEFGMKGLIV